MRLAKVLAIVACGGLLSAGVIGSARHSYAQDAGENDASAGAWSPGGTGSPDLSNLKAKVPPLDIFGCWQGDVEDTDDGLGTAVFQFNQNLKGNKLRFGSTFDFEWGDGAFAHGPMKGKVTSKGFKFKGNAGKQCPVSGSGTGDETSLTGTAKFGGECAKFFKNVTFLITPGCI